MKSVYLVPGREKSVRNRHPWVFRGAIGRVDDEPEFGETVRVLSSHGAVLGFGAWSPHSQITVRMWSFDDDATIDAAFLRTRLEHAIAARAGDARAGGNAVRLVHAESDGLPGLHVDRYGEFLVLQCLAAGVERHKREIVAALGELLTPRGIYERSDADVRGKEGLQPVVGVLAGEAPPPRIEIVEGRCRFLVDVAAGHKTGFYLDQRENRAIVGELAAGGAVLNAFSYTGAFAMHALAGGARHVTNVDTSASSLEAAAAHAELNGFDASLSSNVEGDVFQTLRRDRDSGRSYDLVVLDPPKFAESKAQVEKAARGYKDINLLAFKLLRPGGILATFSCSGLMPPDLFQKIVADAALDARRTGRILRRLGQSPDHATALPFPEGTYLKGLVVRVE